jgi:DNA polymerase-1
MTYLVLDLETSITEMYGRKANPFFNDIVAIGHTQHFRTPYSEFTSKNILKFDLLGILDKEEKLLVGHNIKFDLLHLWENENLQWWLRNGGQIYCTQLAEFMLTGQQSKFPALRDIAVNKYAGQYRDKVMEPYWEDNVKVVHLKTKKIISFFPKNTTTIDVAKWLDKTGTHTVAIVHGPIDTRDIPNELVLEDVKNDVLDTEQVYVQQQEALSKNPLMKALIELQMDALLATTEMEFNGMKVDLLALKSNRRTLQNELEKLEKRLVELTVPIYGRDFNPGSPAQLSTLLFGGTITKETIEPVMDEQGKPTVFKSGAQKGNIKFKKVFLTQQIQGLGLRSIVNTPSGSPSTNEEALSKLDHEIPKLILQIRGLKKQISTYYDATEALIYETDGCIHPTISHCGYGDGDFKSGGAATGRLSSANPNAQNQPKPADSRVREHFVSRYNGGSLIAADFSQLEIVVQAQLSQDPIYIQDIKNGVDFHIKRLAMKEEIPYDEAVRKIKEEKDPVWIEKRSKIKQFSFQRSYGAGAKHISEKSGIPFEDCKTLIANEDLEYKGLTAYNRRLQEIVEYNAQGSDKGWYKSPTGRIYFFEKKEAPDWLKQRGIQKSFTPTQIKNYIVQGTATADIVLILLGMFWREAIKHRDKFLLINTVHDDILLDVRPGHEDFARQMLLDVLTFENVVKVFKERFNYAWTVPIKVEIKQGKTWYDLE